MRERPPVAFGAPVALLSVDELDFAFTILGWWSTMVCTLPTVVVSTWIVSARLVTGVELFLSETLLLLGTLFSPMTFLVAVLAEIIRLVASRSASRLDECVYHFLQFGGGGQVDIPVVSVHGFSSPWHVPLRAISCCPAAHGTSPWRPWSPTAHPACRPPWLGAHQRSSCVALPGVYCSTERELREEDNGSPYSWCLQLP